MWLLETDQQGVRDGIYSVPGWFFMKYLQISFLATFNSTFLSQFFHQVI